MEKKTVLIVEDIELNREILKCYFQDRFQVLEAENGEEALEILRHQKVDIVITDIVMPVMDGLEMVRQIRSQPELENLAVIAITDYGEEYELRALKAGADDFINKPFQPELLGHRVEMTLTQERVPKQFSFYPLASNLIKLPFAIVKLNDNSASYQYVNDSYAELSKSTTDVILNQIKEIEDPSFLEFLREIKKQGVVSKKTFFVERNGKYYDVVANIERDDFICFTVSENFERQAHMNEKEKYQYLLREVTKVNPDTLGIVHINLTRGICSGCTGIPGVFDSFTLPTEVDTLVQKMAEYFILEEEKQQFLHRYGIQEIMKAFHNGIFQLQDSFLVSGRDKRTMWISIHLKMTRNPLSDEMEAIAYCIDETTKRLSQQVIDTVVKEDYDVLFYIDMLGDSATIFSGGKDAAWGTPYPLSAIDEAIQDYLREHYIGEDKEQFIKDNSIRAIARKMENMDDMVVDYRLMEDGRGHLKRGHYYWLDRNRLYMCFTRTDITDSFENEQKRSEELSRRLEEARTDERKQLKEKENLKEKYYEEIRQKDVMMDSLLHNIPGGIAIYKIGDKIETLYSSEGVPKLSGRTMEEYNEWIAEDLLENTVHPDDQSLMMEQIARNAPFGRPINVTYRLHHKNGTYVWTMLSAVKIREEEGIPIYYAIYTNVPEQVAQYAELCENSPTAIHVIDAKTSEILFVNQEAKRLAGVESDLKGQICYRALMKGDSVCDFCSRNQAEHNCIVEKSIVLPMNGRSYATKGKLIDWNGREAYVNYLTDETNFVKEQQQNERLRQAQEANKAKTEFLSRVSHDMRTPMNGILGLATLAQDETDVEELQSSIRQIQISGRYLLNLINDTLDMSQIETGMMELHPQIYQGGQLIENILSNASIMAKNKNVQFQTNIPDLEWKPVMIDAPRVEQIIINLISNAVKYTPEGGLVEFSMEVVSCNDYAIRDRFLVKDNGIGMSEEFLPHLFEVFSRENRINTDREYGTGLGMSIVKKLVDLMNGDISVKSEIGVGTEVSVTLEFQFTDKEADYQRIAQRDGSDLAGKRILVCEDHPLNAQIAMKLLDKKGVKTDWAENGQKGVEMMAHSKRGYYDAILMDIRMPVMDGLTAAGQIRSLEREDAKKIPIIAMTANAFSEDVQKSKEAGMNAHLGKPIDPQIFYATLSRCMEQNH